jgi:hypothetical protein
VSKEVSLTVASGTLEVVGEVEANGFVLSSLIYK